MTSKNEMTCETCKGESKSEVAGVASIPGIPLSVAYCFKCLEENAHPAWALRDQVILCGGVMGVDPEYIIAFNVWYDGQYMPFRQYLAVCPITEEEIKKYG